MKAQYTIGYFKSAKGNVGDDLNDWLWPKVLTNFEFVDSADNVLVGIGSVLDSRYDEYKHKLVLGAGARGKDSVPTLDDSWDVQFVRGKNTVAALKDQRSVNYITDPAILIAKFFKRKSNPNKIGLVPYYKSSQTHWKAVADKLGMEFISPENSVETFVEKLSECKFVVTEAMHGAIFADSLRVPWFPYSSFTKHHEQQTHFFKWTDWADSMDIKFKELNLPILWESDSKLKSFLKKRKIVNSLGRITEQQCFLSTDSIFKDKLHQIESLIASLSPRVE